MPVGGSPPSTHVLVLVQAALLVALLEAGVQSQMRPVHVAEGSPAMGAYLAAGDGRTTTDWTAFLILCGVMIVVIMYYAGSRR